MLGLESYFKPFAGSPSLDAEDANAYSHNFTGKLMGLNFKLCIQWIEVSPQCLHSKDSLGLVIGLQSGLNIWDVCYYSHYKLHSKTYLHPVHQEEYKSSVSNSNESLLSDSIEGSHDEN
jgi:hypothetical protein